MNTRAKDAERFIDAAGWGDARRVFLAGDASNRRYDRLTKPDGTTAVFMDAPPDKGETVQPFITIAEFLIHNGLSAPQILMQDVARGFLLIEDLGDALFARLMADSPEMTEPLYAAAIDTLVQLHKAVPPDLPLCDSNWLVTMSDLPFDWYANNPDAFGQFDPLFRPLAAQFDAEASVVILRDFHAENLLWRQDHAGLARVGLLDFQDALVGHPAYDLVSILQDARRDVDPAIEAKMISRYLSQTGSAPVAFHSAYAVLGAQRNLRILGIFARLCLRDGKPHYIDYIPRVWGYLQRNLAHPDLAELAVFLNASLPYPSPEFLKDLKARCATHPTP